MRDRLAGCIFGTNVAPLEPRRDVAWSHSNQPLSPTWPPADPGGATRFGERFLARSRVSANHRSPQDRAYWVCWIGNRVVL
jgi:hypothetical protein